jgi:L-ascorbate metabolism protein UlaG (beta-lactamase superfamily)
MSNKIGGGVKITFFGHSAFRMESPEGKAVAVDPWLENPALSTSVEDLKPLSAILVTHAHGDHLGQVVELAKATNAAVVAQPEICAFLGTRGVGNLIGMNKGGTVDVDGIKVTMTHAVHSSSIDTGQGLIPGGDPAGFVVTFENGFSVYHAGDTGACMDMKIIGDIYSPDVAMLPIGSHYVMDPREAAYAAKLIRPRFVIPMHFGTFPVLSGTPGELVELLKGEAVEVVVMAAGESVM